MTNHHVVEGCSSLAVNGNKAARVQAYDWRNDLALITVTGDAGPSAEISSERPRLGESVTVAGFPLHGLLSGLTVTSGTISSLSGLRNDNRHLQISAAVQPGNSGGPLLNSAGAVAGVVVSKLDAVKVAELTGDIPQNVNFAVKASILRSLLDSSGVN